MRIEGWERRLNDYLEKVRNELFNWGTCDCLIFASDVAVICTGIDPMNKKNNTDPETIRGLYQTKKEAVELIRKFRKSTPDIMDVHFVRKHVNFAGRGDIVYYKKAFGVCVGRGLAYFKNETKGFEVIKIRECKIAWEIN